MTTDKLLPEVRKTIVPEFQFLFRTEFYHKFFEEVIAKTLEAIEKENELKLTENDK